MAKIEIGDVLGEWEGYEVVAASRRDGVVEVELDPIAERAGICTGCDQQVAAIHGYERRRVRDLPILDAPTKLVLRRRRLACPRCGPKLEQLSWLAPYARVTQRLADNVAQLCTVLTIKQVANHYQLGWDAVRDMDKGYLQRAYGQADVRGVTQLVMDDFALPSGRKFATVITDAVTRRVLWVSKGRTREDIRPFFEILGRAGCEDIEVVSMDMNGAYEPEIRQHCPRARIVYNLFPMVAKYGARRNRAATVGDADSRLP